MVYREDEDRRRGRIGEGCGREGKKRWVKRRKKEVKEKENKKGYASWRH